MQLSISVIYPYSVAHFLTYSLAYYFFIGFGAQLDKFELVEAMEFIEKTSAVRMGS